MDFFQKLNDPDPSGEELQSNTSITIPYESYINIAVNEAGGTLLPVPNSNGKVNRRRSYSQFANTRTDASDNQGSSNHIQLWQFLLELLTDPDCVEYITWIGNDGKFKFLEPDTVAKKWGERKNKPNMNYEKLARGLRYYYETQTLCKVPNERYVYKYVCNLKDLLGGHYIERIRV